MSPKVFYVWDFPLPAQCSTLLAQAHRKVVSIIQFNKYNKSSEHNMATLLAKKIFTNYNSSLLRQHTVNQSFFFSLYVYTSAAHRASPYKLCDPPVG